MSVSQCERNRKDNEPTKTTIHGPIKNIQPQQTHTAHKETTTRGEKERQENTRCHTIGRARGWDGARARRPPSSGRGTRNHTAYTIDRNPKGKCARRLGASDCLVARFREDVCGCFTCIRSAVCLFVGAGRVPRFASLPRGVCNLQRIVYCSALSRGDRHVMVRRQSARGDAEGR